ncbi:MAG: hypothetical protein A3G49_01535 [Candidatus Sungbacteria bacterium RIFCSPLOWO2_12_FULL_41_11]|uniref:DUF2283 domain-containing protein n=1 Tax=Candidatus Sungbacteria bacterium RIFCSPLOWO2_12_FULL_41_11 TaxID=1802286 RepID=A0A1G2LQL3_9BACT|nr:MAG: hypothetical protein UV01_C0011G0026 [Parcubacteria group bacterium GW2011_GWA2_42_14]OGZ97313.1 MAG: hypothetical protein A3D41_04840 [Candidatus Sungbacteria bacterium RIFCSPHIGHO2_02_FULL_41_12b]OHA13905.1 MAG: hypothetical protein A3G49_01535 [Candidatus Sungbacteria bacterium RIFCSPLOWO2_12_FULL_41_11]
MIYTYDPMADAINITFKKGKVAETKEIADGVLLDIDKNGSPLYLEILFARKRFGKEKVGNLSLKPFLYSSAKVRNGIAVK